MAEQQPGNTNVGSQEQLLYKNRLQEFTQRAKRPLPVYHTINEGGARDVPKFRSTVEVDGKTYTSSNTFSSKKAAEQDVAKLALEGISQSIKDCVSRKTYEEGFPPVYEDRVFCKSILHEFAAKMSLEKPVYKTVRSERAVPVFISSLEFEGVTYTGEPSVTKKEAEQLAARAAILSILGNSGAATLLSEIVKSKAELFSALNEGSGREVKTVANKEQISGDPGQAGEGINYGRSDALQVLSPDVTRHVFKKPLAEATVSQATSLPMSFVPSSDIEPTLLSNGGKRKCKSKKKKANKKMRAELVTHVSGPNLLQAVPGSAA